jgi:phosphonate transport system substrate-binding protein
MLRSKGIDPDTFFGKQTFADDHENAIRQVIEGEADCAAAASPFVNLDTKTTVRGADELTVVAKTKRIPLDCLVVHKRLARGLAERLRAALFELVHAGGTSDKLDDSWGLDGFVQPMHESYDEVEQVERMLDG